MPDLPKIYRLYYPGLWPFCLLVRWGTRPKGWPMARVPGHVADVVVRGPWIFKYESTWPAVKLTTLTGLQWQELQAGKGLVCKPVFRHIEDPEAAAAFLHSKVGDPYGILPLALDFAYWATERIWGWFFRREHVIFSIRRRIGNGGMDCAEYVNRADREGGGHYVWSACPVSPAELLAEDVRAGLVSFQL